MTNQPPKWVIVERDSGDPDYAVSLIRSGKTTIAAFYGPDREANAKLFIRAHHMDELVESVKQTRLAIDTLQSQVNDTGEYDEHAALGLFYGHEILGTILAKIEGTP